MATENLQIERFTIDHVMETRKLQQMGKQKLIKHIEKLERHCMQLDNGLSIVLKNIETVKRAQKRLDAQDNTLPEE